MNQFEFIEKRRSSWKELEQVLVESRRRRPEVASIRRLGRLYRHAAADLAFAKTCFPDSSAIPYLNQLVAEGHSHIYGRQLVIFKRLAVFFRSTFPETLKQARVFVAAATAFFLVAALFAFIAVSMNEKYAKSIVPEGMAEKAAENAGNTSIDEMQIESAMITVNNIGVSFMAFALGVFFGAGTVYVLILNGLLIGALTAVYAKYGLSVMFWSLILPHGSLELPAILIAAGAGLMLGDSLIRPGEVRRGEAFAAAARRSIILIGGVIPVFIIAGLIEGFITPLDVPESIKLTFAAFVGLAGLAYFGSAFWRKDRDLVKP